MLNTPKQRAGNLAAQMERRAKEQKALREPEEIAPVFAEMRLPEGEKRTALQALMRNALSGPAASLAAPHATVQVVGVTGNLERDGCDFVRMAYLFIEILECPAGARELVLAVCALSAGNSEDFLIMTDDQIAELIGYSRKYVKQKRDALIKWQWEKDLALVDIKQKGRDPVTHKWLPTEYRARAVPVFAHFIRRARTINTRSTDYAQKRAIEAGYREIVHELRDEHIPNSPMMELRDSKTFGSNRQAAGPSQMPLSTGQRDHLTGQIINHLRRSMELKQNPWEVWGEMGGLVEKAIWEMTKGRAEYMK